MASFSLTWTGYKTSFNVLSSRHRSRPHQLLSRSYRFVCDPEVATAPCAGIDYCGKGNSSQGLFLVDHATFPAGPCLNQACFDHDLCYSRQCVKRCPFSRQTADYTPCDSRLVNACASCKYAGSDLLWIHSNLFVCAIVDGLLATKDFCSVPPRSLFGCSADCLLGPYADGSRRCLRSKTVHSLSAWTPYWYSNIGDDQPDAVWVWYSDNTVVTQTVNSNPSLLLSPFTTLADETFIGTLRVDTNFFDDDLVGFVFGYQDPEHYYLFDWRRGSGPDNSNCGDADTGMSVKRVNAARPLTCQDLWSTSGTDAVQLLRHNSQPWDYATNYDFVLRLQPGSFTITIRQGGALLESWQINDSTYGPGRFGFYDYSQEGLRAMAFSPCGVPDADSDGIPDQCDTCKMTVVPGQERGEWASLATSSSEYGTTQYSAWQATGSPQVTGCDNSPEAWAPRLGEPSPEWLEVRLDVPVHSTGITVRETYNLGFVTRIDLIDLQNTLHTVWTDGDATTCAYPFFSATWPSSPYPAIGARIYTAHPTWEEIDAVEIIGTPADLCH